jgi:hypothetical protein
VTAPSGPLIVLGLVDATCEPSETLAVGALIESAPAVNVNVVGVAAPTGAAAAMASTAKMLARIKKLRIMMCSARCASLPPVSSL